MSAPSAFLHSLHLFNIHISKVIRGIRSFIYHTTHYFPCAPCKSPLLSFFVPPLHHSEANSGFPLKHLLVNLNGFCGGGEEILRLNKNYELAGETEPDMHGELWEVRGSSARVLNMWRLTADKQREFQLLQSVIGRRSRERRERERHER